MSRLPSARGAKGGAAKKSGGRSAPGGRPGVFVQTPKSDIYVVLLGVALGAIFIGMLFMVLILNGYGFSTKAV